MEKLVVFHPALAPYRVDFLNCLNKAFDAKFYFNHQNVIDQKFNQDALKRKLTFSPKYLNSGFEIMGRSFRFGVIKIIKKAKPKVILCSEYGSITVTICLYKIITKQKFKIYTISDDSIHKSKSRRGLRAILRNLISTNIDGVIFPSKEVCNWHITNISKNIKTLELPIIHDDISFRNQLAQSLNNADTNILKYKLLHKKVILFVGRLVTIKNIPFLLKVVSQLKNNDWKLAIVGGGQLESTLKAQAQELNIESSVIFTGRKEGNELLCWYSIASVLVLPSTFESFGAVVNEALLGGCYVLCSQTAGASSLINSDNGKIFNPYKEESLRVCLEYTLKISEPILNNNIVTLRESRMPFSFKSKTDTLLKSL